MFNSIIEHSVQQFFIIYINEGGQKYMTMNQHPFMTASVQTKTFITSKKGGFIAGLLYYTGLILPRCTW